MLFETTSEVLVQRRISVEVSCPPAEGGQKDICFSSASTVAALLWSYLPPSISSWSEHATPLPESKPPRLQEVLAREQRKSWCEVGGRGQEATAGNDNVCQAICPWQRPPYPGGVTGGYKTSASVLRPTDVPRDPTDVSVWKTLTKPYLASVGRREVSRATL